MSDKPGIVHYNDGDGKAACRPSMYKPKLTARPSRVECPNCRATRAYKEMMDGDRI